jgi:hypothetical protein
MRRWTSATAGAETVERLSPGGDARSAGFEGTKPHLTARPSAACRRKCSRRTDAGDRPRSVRQGWTQQEVAARLSRLTATHSPGRPSRPWSTATTGSVGAFRPPRAVLALVLFDVPIAYFFVPPPQPGSERAQLADTGRPVVPRRTGCRDRYQEPRGGGPGSCGHPGSQDGRRCMARCHLPVRPDRA